MYTCLALFRLLMLCHVNNVCVSVCLVPIDDITLGVLIIVVLKTGNGISIINLALGWYN